MKKIILGLCVLFSSLGFAQIGEVETLNEPYTIGVANKAVGLPKLEVVKFEGQDVHSIYYYNLEYPSIREVESLNFIASKEDLNYVYEFLRGQFETKETKSLKLGEDEIIVNKVSSSIRISKNNENSWFYLSKKQLDRLFNKA
jgi:hypothetical protein